MSTGGGLGGSNPMMSMMMMPQNGAQHQLPQQQQQPLGGVPGTGNIGSMPQRGQSDPFGAGLLPASFSQMSLGQQNGPSSPFMPNTGGIAPPAQQPQTTMGFPNGTSGGMVGMTSPGQANRSDPFACLASMPPPGASRAVQQPMNNAMQQRQNLMMMMMSERQQQQQQQAAMHVPQGQAGLTGGPPITFDASLF